MWRRDAFGNSVAEAHFEGETKSLTITSEAVLEQYYEHGPQLSQRTSERDTSTDPALRTFLSNFLDVQNVALKPLEAWLLLGESTTMPALIDRLADIASAIKARLRYIRRDEPGIQDPIETLAMGSGSCRDFAWLMMVALRQQDWPSRFVTGYLTSSEHPDASGATHAWLEVYLNDLGWVGVDPTCGDLVRGKHIAVATSQRPDQLPPVAGSFVGPSQTHSTLEVSVSAQFVDS
jgi:transglutaminase-like putative cysteine protease